jgi:hypothetical protein
MKKKAIFQGFQAKSGLIRQKPLFFDSNFFGFKEEIKPGIGINLRGMVSYFAGD